MLRLAVVLSCLLALVPSAVARAQAPPVLDDDAKQEQILEVLEAFVPFAERFWRPSDLAEPRTGWFDAVGSGVTQARGSGDIVQMYATLLTARPDQQSFAGVDRATLREHAIQAIRHTALTSKLSGAGYNRWGNGTWQASLETYHWGFGAKLLWDDLDAETRALVEKVVTGEADILVTKPPAKGVEGDTGAEDNGWNTPTPALAAAMFPDHPRAAAWDEAAKRHAINGSTRAADAGAATPVLDGKPLGEWFHGAVVHPDLTMENHGFYNPIYQMVTPALIGEGAIFAAHAGRPVPDAFSFRVEEIWDRVLGPSLADDGDLIMTAGQDWTAKDYQHLYYLSVLSTRFKRADASLAESRALQQVAKRQAARTDGAIIGQPQLGYESMLVERLSSAWWNHELFGPSIVPTEEQLAADRAKTDGVRSYPHISTVQAPLRDAFVSMSWDTARAMGLVVPKATGHADDPILTAYTVRSLVGSATGATGPYTCDCREDRFSTAGTIGARRFSMTAFADGVTMLLDRGTGSTFNFAFERIAGLTGDRTVFHSGGTGLGALPGTWANVADRLGVVVAGGSGLRAADVGGGNPYRLVEGSTATGTGNRGALVLPNSDHEVTGVLAEDVVQPEAPDGWSALYGRAPDGTGRLAIARWAGGEQASFVIRDERGAPVTRGGTTTDGDTATTTSDLGSPDAASGDDASGDAAGDDESDADESGDAAAASNGPVAPASRGETVRFFVDADGPLRARALGDDRAELVNAGASPVTAKVTYVRAGGDPLVATRVLLPGEGTPVRVIDGRLVTAGSEYEDLVAARDRMAALADQVKAWLRAGTITRDQAARLLGQLTAIDVALDRAIAHASAESPRTTQAAVAVDAARALVALLRPNRVPDAVADRIAADRRATLELLRHARETGLGLALRVVPEGTALQGEPLTVRALLVNRGDLPATSGQLTVRGWSTVTREVPTIRPGGTAQIAVELPVPDDATGGEVTAELRYRSGFVPKTVSDTAAVDVQPAVELLADDDVVPLAQGGWNRVRATVVNRTGHDLPVTLTAQTADGVTATVPDGETTVPANGTADVPVTLANASVASGQTELKLVAAAGARTAETTVGLRHSANLALNGLGAAWPAAFASGQQDAYPPSLATDGATSTFWVSAGSSPSTGPSPTNPIMLGTDFGAPLTVGRVIVTPRPNYGPKTYTVEVSDDGETWRQVASEALTSASAPTTSTFTPTTARRVRIRITGGHDRGGAGGTARNVQVAELDVRP